MNSATSVLGSVLATVVSLHAGIDAAIGIGAALYLCAFALASRVVSARSRGAHGRRWAQSPTPRSAGPSRTSVPGKSVSLKNPALLFR